MKANRYIAMVDILGFTELVRRNSIDRIVRVVEYIYTKASDVPVTWATSSRDGTQHSGTSALNKLYFSDTFIFWSPPINGSLQYEQELVRLFFNAIGQVLFNGFIAGIPLRAGLAFGESYINLERGTLVGQAIVDAYETESAQDWIGGALHSGCPVDGLLAPLPLVVDYPVPTKLFNKKPIKYALNWTRPGVTPGQSHMKQKVGWSCRERLESAFANYLAEKLPATVETKYLNAHIFYKTQMDARPRIDWLGQPLD